MIGAAKAEHNNLHSGTMEYGPPPPPPKAQHIPTVTTSQARSLSMALSTRKLLRHGSSSLGEITGVFAHRIAGSCGFVPGSGSGYVEGPREQRIRGRVHSYGSVQNVSLMATCEPNTLFLVRQVSVVTLDTLKNHIFKNPLPDGCS